MPRPEGKPPTEGGKRLQEELNKFVDNSNSKEVVREISNYELHATIHFLIDKIAELEDKINELSKE